MSAITSTDMSNLMAARRLLQIAREAEARQKGKTVEEKSILDYMEEDRALISDAALDAKNEASASPSIENININLAEIKDAAKGNAAVTKQNPPQRGTEGNGVEITGSQSIEIKLELRYRSNAAVEGLVVHDKNYAESDRYLFKFADGATFTILDKWTNKSTTIWGDPHVDVNDVEGNNNGDFKDLKASDDFTTLMLSDGTRVTFKAKDSGVIEQVDIFKGSQHIKGTGQASKGFSAETGLFTNQVLDDGVSKASSTPLGDIVHAGGDGNDWFDANNKLVWGKTTGPVVTHRPPATLEFYYKQSVTQSVSAKTTVTG